MNDKSDKDDGDFDKKRLFQLTVASLFLLAATLVLFNQVYTPPQTDADVSVSEHTNGEETFELEYMNGDTEEVVLYWNDTNQHRLTEVGDSVTVNPETGTEVAIIGVRASDGGREVITVYRV